MAISYVSSKGWLGRKRQLLLIGGPVLLLVILSFFYLTGGRYLSTDDAYVQAELVEISSNISARVTEIDVKDNQEVHQGDVLFKLDDRSFAIDVEEAKAKLASTKLEIAALKATYRQRSADRNAAADAVAYSSREFKRQSALVGDGISSQAQLDLARHALTDAEEKQQAAIHQQENVLASLGGNPNITVEDHPAVKQAQAMLDRAELNLSHAVVRAPMDGVVSKVERLQVGDYVNAATPVFPLISKNVWIEANFKETELTYMRPGQSVSFTIDTYPDRRFHGRVESVSPGTGSAFSLLPPENASGNWVKVVQRLPVRISIDDADPGNPLHSGLSANVEVDTHHSRLWGG